MTQQHYPYRPETRKARIIIGVAAVILLLILLTTCNGSTESQIEDSAKDVVTQILQEQHDIDLTCEEVTITKEYAENRYDAKAVLSNSVVISTSIEYIPSKDQIFVEIPYIELLRLY